MTAATTAIDLVSLRENILRDLLLSAPQRFAPRTPSLRRGTLRHISHPAARPWDLGPGATPPSDRLARMDVQAMLPLCAIVVVVSNWRTSRWLTSAAPPGMTGDIYEANSESPRLTYLYVH